MTGFGQKIGSGFGESGGTPPPRIPRSTPPGLDDPPVLNFHSKETIMLKRKEKQLTKEAEW